MKESVNLKGNPEHQMLRAEAILWWEKQDYKAMLCQKYFTSRKYSSLTGREIQIIYNAEINKVN